MIFGSIHFYKGNIIAKIVHKVINMICFIHLRGHFSSDQMMRAVASLSPPPHPYYHSNNCSGRQYSTNLGPGSASPGAIASQTLTEINAMPSYGEDISGSPIYGHE